MHVQVMLVRDNEGYKVRVIALEEPSRNWFKLYRTKEFCMEQLWAAEMLTPEESEKALRSDFDHTEAILTFNAEVESNLLRAIGFS